VGWNVRGMESATIRRSRFSAVLSWLAWAMCLLGLVFAGALAVVLSDPDEVIFGLSPLLEGLLQTTKVIAVLSAITVLGCLIAWGARYWRFSGRLHYTLVALAGVGLVWFLYHWKLLTWGVG
jgi:hypothetical protein